MELRICSGGHTQVDDKPHAGWPGVRLNAGSLTQALLPRLRNLQVPTSRHGVATVAGSRPPIRWRRDSEWRWGGAEGMCRPQRRSSVRWVAVLRAARMAMAGPRPPIRWRGTARAMQCGKGRWPGVAYAWSAGAGEAGDECSESGVGGAEDKGGQGRRQVV